MSKYAVVQLQGKQYKVSPGDVFVVDRLETDEGKKLETTDVLLIVDGAKQKIGDPLVKNAQVEFKVLSHQKGKKIRVAKFKAKSRYRRVRGHRQYQTTLEVVKISA